MAIGWLSWGLLDESGRIFVPGCPFHELTGLHCPGCGTTRAVKAALHGDFRQAFAYNQLAIVVLPVVGLAIINSLGTWAGVFSASRPKRWIKYVTWILVAAMITYGVLRNLPWPPFDLLAPHVLDG